MFYQLVNALLNNATPPLDVYDAATWSAVTELSERSVANRSAVQEFPEVLDCYVVLGNVDFLLRIVTEDIKAYEQFFFEKLSQLPGIQEVNSSIVLSDIKHTTVLPISP